MIARVGNKIAVIGYLNYLRNRCKRDRRTNITNYKYCNFLTNYLFSVRVVYVSQTYFKAFFITIIAVKALTIIAVKVIKYEEEVYQDFTKAYFYDNS